MMNRRTWLQTTLAAASTAAFPSAWAQALATSGPLLTRAIPSSGQRVPIIGLGSSATFAQAASAADREALKSVMAKLVELGGTVFDTAPSYGASEDVAGSIAKELGLAQKLFWATKLNVAPRGGGMADVAAAQAQLQASFKRIGKPVIDLVQIHNMGDVNTQLPILQEAKQQGRIRYLGVTTTFSNQYDSLLETMRTQKIDFIGTNYAIDDLFAEKTILPLAQERGIAVLVYAPFGRTRLWNRVKGQALPDWAKEFDATTWAQFFLKFVASHPAVTCITPATSRVSNMVDNMAGGVGRLPDAQMRKQMIKWIDGLPSA